MTENLMIMIQGNFLLITLAQPNNIHDFSSLTRKKKDPHIEKQRDVYNS